MSEEKVRYKVDIGKVVAVPQEFQVWVPRVVYVRLRALSISTGIPIQPLVLTLIELGMPHLSKGLAMTIRDERKEYLQRRREESIQRQLGKK